MNTVNVTALPKRNSKLLIGLALLAVAVVTALAPRPARADGAEAVAAVLVGAALLYAVQDDDHHAGARVSYHFHDGGHRRCYEHHAHGYGRPSYGNTYYVYQDSHRYERNYYDRRDGDRHYDRRDKHYDKGGRHDRDGGYAWRGNERRWNTRVPVH